MISEEDFILASVALDIGWGNAKVPGSPLPTAGAVAILRNECGWTIKHAFAMINAVCEYRDRIDNP